MLLNLIFQNFIIAEDRRKCRVFFCQMSFCRNFAKKAVKSQKKWLFLYQSLVSRYNDMVAMSRLYSIKK